MIGKEIFAKLLATENITIKHMDIPTAAFNVKDRDLMLPNWKEDQTTEAITDLLLGHEVGHALYTYPDDKFEEADVNKHFESLYNSVDPENLSIVQQFYNVIEDARIEKKMKFKFPGLNSVMYRGYKDLWGKNFFGAKGLDLDEMNFIDRINVQYKMGTQVNIKFSEQETKFLDEIDSLETFTQVNEFIPRLYNYCKDKHVESMQDPSWLEELLAGDEVERDEFIVGGSDGDIGKGEYKSLEQLKTELDGHEPGGPGGDLDGRQGTQSMVGMEVSAPDPNKAFGSSTLDAMEQNIKDQIIINDSFGANHRYLEIPYPSKDILDFSIMKIQDIMKDDRTTSAILEKVPFSDMSSPKWDSHWECPKQKQEAREYSAKYYLMEGLSQGQKIWTAWNVESKPEITYLVRNFLQKMKAKEYQRTKTNLSGDLDENKLWAYKIDDSLFKQAEIHYKGKDHGFVMFIDFSYSMDRHMIHCIKQVIKLARFCRKLAIPFDVYSFTDSGGHPHSFYNTADHDSLVRNYGEFQNDLVDATQVGEMVLQPVQLINLLSSKMRNQEFENCAKYLFFFGLGKTESGVMRLRGTPLNSTIILANAILDNFKAEYKVDVMNVIFLTDGESQNGPIQNIKTHERRDGIPVRDFAGVPTGEFRKEDGESAMKYVSYYAGDGKIYFIDKHNGNKTYHVGNEYGEGYRILLKNLKDRQKCNLLGFFAMDGSNIWGALKTNVFTKVLPNFIYGGSLFKKMQKDFRKTRCLVLGEGQTGFDEYYIMSFRHKKSEETVDSMIGVDKRRIRTFFKKSLASKKESKLILDKFIEQVVTNL